MKTFNIIIKEVGNDHLINTSYSGTVTEEYVINFFFWFKKS